LNQTRFINPRGLQKSPGYTHVVEVTAPARLVYIAGQLGSNVEGELSSDFRQQAVQTFENLKVALAAVGGQFHDVVKFNNYLVDMKYLPIFRQVQNSYLPDENRPASTTVAVSSLARAGAFLEIEAIAVLPAITRERAAGNVRGRSTATTAARRKGR